jgi:sterol desaturase/sphingolipid hydroxylase (fatty acid hydroxylase superfamily)
MLPLLETQFHKLLQAGANLLSPGSIFGLPQAGFAFGLAVVWLGVRQWRRRGAMRPMVLVRALKGSGRIITHPSTRADLFYYFVNTFAIGGLIGWGIVSGLAVSHGVVHGLDAVFGGRRASLAPVWVWRVGITVAAFLGYEFGYYVDHYAKHKIPFLWAFHQTHHSAEVLTPLTVFRVHPVDTLIFVDVVAACAGVAHGLVSYAAGRPVDLYVVDGANVLSVAGLFLLAQLQHSQFWIPLRGLAGRLLLSPAHHQIHHSTDPAHFNSNLGSFVAVFDWLFGTLVVPPEKSPGLVFGVEQQSGEPHRVLTLLLAPFGNALRLGGRPLGPAAVARDTPEV